MYTQRLYRLGLAVYALAPNGISLVKVGRRSAPSPGQMDLFSMESIAAPAEPKEGDRRTNRAGNEEVLRGGRWHLSTDPEAAPDSIGGLPVIDDADAGVEIKTVDNAAIGKRIVSALRSDFYERMKPQEAEYFGFDPNHPSLGWDENLIDESMKLVQSGGVASLAEKYLNDIDDAGGSSVMKAVVNNALSMVDWDSVKQYALAKIDGSDVDFEGDEASSTIAGWLTNKINYYDEEENDRAMQSLKTKVDTDLKSFTKKQLNRDEDLSVNVTNLGIELADTNAIGEQIAAAMKIPQAIEYGKPLRAVDEKKTQFHKEGRLVTTFPELVDWWSVADALKTGKSLPAGSLEQAAIDSLQQSKRLSPEIRQEGIEGLKEGYAGGESARSLWTNAYEWNDIVRFMESEAGAQAYANRRNNHNFREHVLEQIRQVNLSKNQPDHLWYLQRKRKLAEVLGVEPEDIESELERMNMAGRLEKSLASCFYRLGEDLYVLSPDGTALVKAGKRNYKQATEYTDDNGRKWIFNQQTRRWGLHPDSKKQKPARKQKGEASPRVAGELKSRSKAAPKEKVEPVDRQSLKAGASKIAKQRISKLEGDINELKSSLTESEEEQKAYLAEARAYIAKAKAAPPDQPFPDLLKPHHNWDTPEEARKWYSADLSKNSILAKLHRDVRDSYKREIREKQAEIKSLQSGVARFIYEGRSLTPNQLGTERNRIKKELKELKSDIDSYKKWSILPSLNIDLDALKGLKDDEPFTDQHGVEYSSARDAREFLSYLKQKRGNVERGIIADKKQQFTKKLATLREFDEQLKAVEQGKEPNFEKLKAIYAED